MWNRMNQQHRLQRPMIHIKCVGEDTALMGGLNERAGQAKKSNREYDVSSRDYRPGQDGRDDKVGQQPQTRQ